MISKAINLKNIKHAKARLSKLANKKTLTKSDIAEVKKIAQFELKAISASIKRRGKPVVGSPSKTARSVYKKAGVNNFISAKK
tara:strand:+ start:285 stop:533 length:249 start_codon:yes stop_codon:yes gene_type:complete